MSLKLPTVRDPSDPSMREIRRAFKELDDPLFGRTEVTLAVAIGQNHIKHKLGRAPARFLVVDKDTSTDIYRFTSVPATADTITLFATASATVTIIFW